MTADNIHIKRRRQTYLAWPLRYVAARTCIELAIGFGIVARVRAIIGWDSEWLRFRYGLQIVVPERSGIGILDLGDQDMPHLVLQQAVHYLLRGQTIIDYHVWAIEHESCYLLYADLLRQVMRTLLWCQSPVLVGIQLSVAIEVLEGIAVLIEDTNTGLRMVAQLRPFSLRDEVELGKNLFADSVPARCSQYEQNNEGVDVFHGYRAA